MHLQERFPGGGCPKCKANAPAVAQAAADAAAREAAAKAAETEKDPKKKAQLEIDAI